MLYSIEDIDNPIFTIYEYENSIPKCGLMSNFLIRGIEKDDKLSRRDSKFIKEGNGNIIFAQSSNDEYETFENFQILMMLYDLLLTYRKIKYVNTLNFIFVCPNPQFFNDEGEKELNEFMIKELTERNINIVYDSKLSKVGADYSLTVKNKTNNTDKKYEYNYAHIIPEKNIPAFIRYSDLMSDIIDKANTDNKDNTDTSNTTNTNSFNNKNNADVLDNIDITDISEKEINWNNKFLDIDRETLRLNNFSNVFVTGELLNTFWDKSYINCFLQSSIIAHTIKLEEFKLNKSSQLIYNPQKKTCLNYQRKHFNYITENKEGKLIINKQPKSIVYSYLFNKFLQKPESYASRKFFLKKEFNLNLNNLFKFNIK